MVPRALALAMTLAACGPKPAPQTETPSDSPPAEVELGRLVGSWRYAPVPGFVEELDVNANGTIAVADYQDGKLKCLWGGSVTAYATGEVYWSSGWRSGDATCDQALSDPSSGVLLWFEDGDTVEFDSAEHKRFRRVDGPLVTDDVVELASTIMNAPPEYAPLFGGGSPDPPEDEPNTGDVRVTVTNPDSWFPALRKSADAFAKVALQGSYFCASYGRSEHSGARWSAVPHVTTSTRYEIVILVPKEGGEASGSLEMDGDTLAMYREESDDGVLWILFAYATIGDDVGALTVDFEDDQEVASMLLACSAVE